MKKKNIITLIMGIAICAILLTACGSKKETTAGTAEESEQSTEETSEPEKEKISLTVGTHGSFSPYAFVDESDTEPQGFEIDVMNEIGRRENLDITFEVAEWTGVFGMLDAGQLDTIACVVTPTDERKEKYDFADPYSKMDIAIAVQKGQASTVSKLEDLAGKKIGVNAGGQAMKKLESLQDTVQFEIVAYDSPTSMEYDLALGRLDGIYESTVAIMQASERGDCEIEVAELEPLATSVSAYPFLKDNEKNKEVINRINEALAEMREDGTLMELSMKWLKLDQVTLD